MNRLWVFGAQVAAPPNKNSLSILDNRTGKKYVVPIEDDTIRASALKTIRVPGGSVLRSYDPGFTNTTSCLSRISFIDGDAGILEYRGYPIEQLAEQSTFEEIAFLLIYGDLPIASQLKNFATKLASSSTLPQSIFDFIRCFPRDAHPMGMFMSCLAALGTLHPEANPCFVGQNAYKSTALRNAVVFQILGAAPTIAAAIGRHYSGRPAPSSDQLSSIDCGFTERFLLNIDPRGEQLPRCPNDENRPHPKLVTALDILFLLHAEHELNCSTAAVRHVSSSNADVFSCIAGGVAALYGPRHGGANEAVVKMLENIGTTENVAPFIEKVRRREQKLMGFGHRVYKNYDPRARLVRQLAEEVFSVVGKEELIEIAMELESYALNDEFFTSRHLYPNVDFYSGLIYRAMGFRTEFFPVLFAIARCSGWLAHWYEFQDDPENKIARPFQCFQGHSRRDFVPMQQRFGPIVPEAKLIADVSNVAIDRPFGSSDSDL